MGRIRHTWDRTFTGQIPLRENCDPLDPRQALLPAFTGFALKGAALMLPVEFFEELSAHLIEYMGVPVESTGRGSHRSSRLLEPLGQSQGWEPRRKYIPPTTVMNAGAAAGKWVTMDEPDPAPRESVKDVLDRMSHADQVEVGNAVLDRMGIEREPVGGPTKYVLVKDLRRYLGLSHAQAAALLDGWGVPNVRPGSHIEYGLAMQIVSHINRVKAGESA